MQTWLFLGFFCFSLVQLQAQTWTLAKDKDGIQVYTRKVPNWGIKEFKAITLVKTNLNQALELIRKVEGHNDWMYNTQESKTLKTQGPNLFFGYSRVPAPWPVSDRDNVTRYEVKQISPQEIHINMRAANELQHPEVKGCVRIKRMEGQWRLRDLQNGQIEITQQALADPAGSIPDWLANSAIIDTPFSTLQSMRKKIQTR